MSDEIIDPVQHIRDNLTTRAAWDFDDYRDFYERDVVGVLLPIAAAHAPLEAAARAARTFLGLCTTASIRCVSAETGESFILTRIDVIAAISAALEQKVTT